MKLILLIIVSYIIGFFTAIPIGATQVEIAKRSISGYFKEAMMVIAGSAASDMIYGFVAMFGIAPFLKDEKVEAFFWFVGGTILIILGIFTLIYSDKNSSNNTEKATLFKSNVSLFIGFSLAATNPPIIFWWLFCFEFIKSIGIVPSSASMYAIIFLLSAGFGIVSYLVSLALFLKKMGKKISPETECRINRIMGILLIALSLYFLFKSTEVFVRFKI